MVVQLVDDKMSRFMGRVGGLHKMRYHAHYHTSGIGYVYQAIKAARKRVQHGSPLGSESWVEPITRRLGLDSALRPRGHPKLNQKEA